MGAGVAVLMLAAGSVVAAPGDLTVRVGVAHVSPNDDSGELSGVAGAEVGVDGATSLGISLTYMAGERIGVGVLGAWPFEHDIKGKGALAGAGTVAEAKHLPPTVTLQYHFAPQAGVRPFVGAGFNYTRFFSEKTRGLGGASIDLDDSWGWALEAGVDVDIADAWALSGQLWYIAIDTTAKLGGGLGDIDVDIDPWVFMLSASRRF
jgi:outer membrane protein